MWRDTIALLLGGGFEGAIYFFANFFEGVIFFVFLDF